MPLPEGAQINEHGQLYISYPYCTWSPGDGDAVLDGDFSAEELRAIADHMDTWNSRRLAKT